MLKPPFTAEDGEYTVPTATNFVVPIGRFPYGDNN